MNSLGVFCGSNSGVDPAYREAAVALAELLVERRITLVYGGGDVGLMGVLADTVMAGGGRVIGVIPQSLVDREVAHRGITELQVVDGMHERKKKIYQQVDAVVALPGGAGTLDELFEAFTWNQLGIHFKPVGILNVGGYYDPLVAWLERAVDQGFLRRAQRDLLVVGTTGAEILAALAAVRPTKVEKWMPMAEGHRRRRRSPAGPL